MKAVVRRQGRAADRSAAVLAMGGTEEPYALRRCALLYRLFDRAG